MSRSLLLFPMKKLCYLLSIVGHALLMLVILNSEFRVTLIPEPPRVVEVAIAEPPLPYYNAQGFPAGAAPGRGFPMPVKENTASSAAAGRTGRAGAGLSSSQGGFPIPATSNFSLGASPHGTFRLALVGKNPDPWELPLGPEAAPQPLRHLPNACNSLAAGNSPGGPGVPGGVFLLPFDIKEKAVAAWTEMVLTRIERNPLDLASAHSLLSTLKQISLLKKS